MQGSNKKCVSFFRWAFYTFMLMSFEYAYLTNPPLSDHRAQIERDLALSTGLNPDDIIVDGLGHISTRGVKYKNYYFCSRAYVKGIPVTWGFFGKVTTNFNKK